MQGGQGRGMRRGIGQGGRGRGGGTALGPGGSCRCPSCGYAAPHQLGVPCYQQSCPKCGTLMIRA